MPKNERHGDWQQSKSEHGDARPRGGGDVCSKGADTLRRDGNAGRDRYSQSNSEKEYRKYGWNVEYANESEEGYSKKA